MVSIIIIVVLLLLSAFFSASETAFSSVNKIRLRNYANQGNKRAERALGIVEKFDKALTAILIGNNIVNIASTSIFTVFFTNTFGPNSVGYSTVVMTIAVLIFGEILPKTFAKENAESVTLFNSSLLSGIMFLLTPITAFFSLLKNAVSKLVNKSKKNDPSVTEEELKCIIDEIEDEGVLEEQESDLVKSALEFDEITINEILVPRVNVVGVEVNQSVEEIKDIFQKERYSRLPVYEKSLDKIIGVIHYKDFFKFYSDGGTDIMSIMQDALFIFEHKKISEVLYVMQKNKSHLAVVVDQYGGTEGIVTLEDILEELVGEIYDENDEDVSMIEAIDNNTYKVNAELTISDLLKELDLPDDTIDTECNSVGGWMMELIGHVPSVGDTGEWGAFKLTVLEMDGQKIETVKLYVENGVEENSENNTEG